LVVFKKSKIDLFLSKRFILPGGSRGLAPPEYSVIFRTSSLFESGTGAAELSFDNLSADLVRTVTNFGLMIVGVSSTRA
jgi:hypothetical protein